MIATYFALYITIIGNPSEFEAYTENGHNVFRINDMVINMLFY